jgi:hypothetical protein
MGHLRAGFLENCMRSLGSGKYSLESSCDLITLDWNVENPIGVQSTVSRCSDDYGGNARLSKRGNWNIFRSFIAGNLAFPVHR